MHILFLTDNFPPESNAPATRTYEHARHWIEAGHQVTVITGAPNFPEGKLYKGYKNRWYEKSELAGIQVIRVKTFISSNEGFALRILDFLSFMMSSFIAGIFQKRPDVIVATSPQFFTTISGWLLSVVKWRPFVFELRDIWPASITAVGAMKESKVIWLLEKLEMFLYRRADKIISVTHSFKSELIERGVSAKKIDVVLNGVELSTYQPRLYKDKAFSEYLGLQDKFVIGYIGTHGMAHALDKTIEAAEILQDNQSIVFLFVGSGAVKVKLKSIVTEKRLKNVIFLDRQEKKDLPAIWSLCDLSLVSLKNTSLFTTVIPSKIFESMGMGVPVLAAIPDGEASDIIRSNKCGVVTLPEEPMQLAETITNLYKNETLLQECRVNAIKAASLYSREKLASIMLSSLEVTKENY